MAEITNVLGIVSIKNRGAYNSQTSYEKLNVVTYNGSSYCAKTSVQGVIPTNTEYWDLMAEKGDKGETGEEGYTPVKGTDYYTAEDIADLESTLSSDVTSEVSEQLSSLTSATPLVASSTAGMTDTSRIYVLSTDGHWYWYDGDSWEDGGVYQASVDPDDVEILQDTVGYSINGEITPNYTLTNTRIFNGVPGEIQGNFSVAIVPITSGAKKVKLNNIVGNQYYDKIAFYTSDTVFKSSTLIEYKVYSSSGNYEENIPSGAITMLLQSNTNISGNIVSGDSYEFICSDVDTRINEHTSSISTLNSQVTDNTNTLGFSINEDLEPSYTYEGYFNNINGVLTSIAIETFKVAKITNLDNVKKVKLNDIYPNSSVSKVAFYNSTTTFDTSTLIEKHSYSSGGSYEENVPSGTKAMLLQNNVDTSGNIIAGDSYELIYKDVDTRLNELAVDNSVNRIVLPDKIFSYVGDTLHMYFDSFIENTIEYSLVVSCQKGRQLKDYYEVSPTSDDVGNHDFTITMYNLNGEVLDTKTATLVISNPTNPESEKNILCVGDSTMTSGQIPIESSRVISGTSGNFSVPLSKNLTNYKFKGRKTNSSETVGWEGTGGWSYESYISSGVNAVRFNVTDITDINIGSVYSVGGSNLTIQEINVTSGTGNIRCTGSVGSIGESGTLSKVSGSGQSSITYTSYQSENYQPFWNNTTNQFDIENYAYTYCNNSVSEIAVLLGINSIAYQPTFSQFVSLMSSVSTFVSDIHSQLPDTKILLSTVPVQATDIGANYGTANVYGNINHKGYKHKILTFNKKLIEFARDKDYVEIINTSAETWNKYCYPHTTNTFSNRYPDTITKYTNVVHPSDNGYAEWSDSFTRAILNN